MWSNLSKVIMLLTGGAGIWTRPPNSKAMFWHATIKSTHRTSPRTQRYGRVSSFSLLSSPQTHTAQAHFKQVIHVQSSHQVVRIREAIMELRHVLTTSAGNWKLEGAQESFTEKTKLTNSVLCPFCRLPARLRGSCLSKTEEGREERECSITTWFNVFYTLVQPQIGFILAHRRQFTFYILNSWICNFDGIRTINIKLTTRIWPCYPKHDHTRGRELPAAVDIQRLIRLLKRTWDFKPLFTNPAKTETVSNYPFRLFVWNAREGNCNFNATVNPTGTTVRNVEVQEESVVCVKGQHRAASSLNPGERNVRLRAWVCADADIHLFTEGTQGRRWRWNPRLLPRSLRHPA